MALVHYVQSLGSFSHKTGSSEALEALSKELAAAGEKTPNKIPVSMAMAKLEQEFTAPPPLVVGKEDRSPGGEILRRVITNPYRAAQVLSEFQSWHAGTRELAAGILQDTPGNGFSVSTATLSPSEWKVLYSELLMRLKPE